MSILPQMTIFDFINLDDYGDLNTLNLILENLPDEKLMQKLEDKRGNGRDDYPIRAMWNAVIAGVVFRHESVGKMIDELKRNGQLRYVCGFRKYRKIRDKKGNITGSEPAVPESWNISRFLSGLMGEQGLIDEMFDEILKEVMTLLPDFGETLAIDGKAIPSYAKKEPKKKDGDRRRDTDANTGIKRYYGDREDGTAWEKITNWFGYKLHLIVDAKYELPVAFSVTKASRSEIAEAKELVKKLGEDNPRIMEGCEYMLGDRGFDDEEIVRVLWDEYKIKPVIDMRNCLEDKDAVMMFKDRNNIVGYDNYGRIYCYDPVMGDRHMMGFGGFEEDRGALKYICACKSYGVNCRGCGKCPYYNKAVRIKLEEDRRRFTPVARSSYKWERLYDMRTAVERVNSRIDNVFGFERHFIRGMKKMRFRCSLALLVMLVLAVGRIKQEQPDFMRKLKTG